MEFRAEAYNLFNTAQFTNPQGASFGTDAATGLPTVNSNGNLGLINSTRAYSERELQFALRFSF
jgi:hypothetical protein